jgi:DMSO/TMAO reductase YedYZ heme-binding membrane subunit
VAAEHTTKIYTIGIVVIVVITAFLALTSIGHVIDAATQHFMLFYAGVFALIGLSASVGLGLVATDRMFLNPGHRVFIQSAHRAASFGAVTFLIIHIITEILAQRVHLLDAVIPFLSPFRTFYIGLGTIASDLVILLVITGILRGRFNASGKAWRWRAIHYTSYASFVFGVWHGLLAGRPGKPYVDWSYGFLIAVVLLGLAVRVFSDSLKPKENLSGPPVTESAGSASAPMRAVAMFAQLAASRANNYGATAVSGGQPVLSAPVLRALPAGTPAGQGQPYYEPGYEGPQRYLGAPRATGSGPMPRASTGPLPLAGSGPRPLAGTGPRPLAGTGPLPPYASGPMPRVPTGPMPAANTGPLPRYASGPMPRVPTGPMPAANTGPLPRYASGPMPRVPSGPMPVPGMGPVPPSAVSGPLPVPPYASGPMPRVPTGPMPWVPTGPMPVANTGPLPPYGSGPMPGVPTGPGTGPRPQFRPPTGPMPRVPTGPLPQAGGRPPSWETGPRYRPPSGPVQPPADGPWRRHGAGPAPAQNGYPPRPPTGPLPQAGGTMPPARYDGSGGWPAGPGSTAGPGWPAGPGSAAGPGWPAGPGSTAGPGWPAGPGWQAGPGSTAGPGWPVAGHDGGRYSAEPPWDALQETDPNLRYREPGPGMPGYRGSRDHRYGGDVRQ